MRRLKEVGRSLVGLVGALTILVSSHAKAEEPAQPALQTLRVLARALMAVEDYTGTVALLKDISVEQGPRRELPRPTNEPCLIIPDPGDRASLICVGNNWLASFDPSAAGAGFTRQARPFSERLTHIFRDFGLELRPRSAVVNDDRLIVDFSRSSQNSGGRYGLLAGISISALSVDWVYDHDDDYTAWAAGSRTLAIASEESRAIVGISVTNGATVWENSEIRTAWTAMVSCGNILVAGSRDTLAAYDEVSGRLLWKTNAPMASLLAAGDRVIVGSGREGVVLLRANSGERLWRRAVNPAADLPLLTWHDDTVLAVAGGAIHRLDIGTGAVRSVQNIPGADDVEAMAAGKTGVHLRTGAGYVCLDAGGQVLHQTAFRERSSWRRFDAPRSDLILWQDRLLIEPAAGRVLNAVDRVTIDDLLELRAAAQCMAEGGKPDGQAGERFPELGRGFGSVLPAVLRAGAAGDISHLHALFMANIHRAMPDARLEMLTELRQNAGLLWFKKRGAYSIYDSPGSFFLTHGWNEQMAVHDLHSGRELYSVPHLSRSHSQPVVTHDGSRLITIDDAAGVLSCRDIRAGRLLWERDLDKLPVAPVTAPSDEPVTRAPGTNDTEVVILEGGPDTQRIALSTEDGSVLWNVGLPTNRYIYSIWFMSGARNTYLERSHRPMRGGARVDRYTARGIDVRTGQERWARRLPGQVTSSDHSALYGAWFSRPDSFKDGKQGKVSVLDMQTGQVVWRQPMADVRTLRLNGERLAISGSDAGRTFLKIFELPTGNPILDTSFPAHEAMPYPYAVTCLGGWVFMGSPAWHEFDSELIRDGEASLLVDVRNGRELGRVAIPPYVLKLNDGILLGADPRSEYLWGFDWNQVLRRARPRPAGQPAAAPTDEEEDKP